MRLVWLTGSLALALLLAVLALQVPRPAPADAPPSAFSAARALADVNEIARAPHPLGSAEHARVQAFLLRRMEGLGLQTSTQTGPISRGSARYLRQMGGDPAAAGYRAVNLIGVLPGRNPELPAVALMVHYDTVPMSPGAADDSAGVAAVLEAVRAIRARGPAERTLVVLFTDAEEIGLDGARIFWGGHSLRDRIGAVVNLEARGGGGRAMMFETGRGNAQTIDLLARVAGRVDGGVTSNSLAVFVYELMPNGTDFTVPRDRGVQGLNLAFIGRPEQYHAAASTPEALDPGSVQHIGSQTLEAADALLRAPRLPARTGDAVYADLFGRIVIAHPPTLGWVLFAGAALLLGFAVWRARSRAGLTLTDIGRGAVDGLWFLSAGLVLAQGVRLLGGPMAARAESADAYYVLLARLPWLEAGVAATLLALVLVLVGGRARLGRVWLAGGVALVAVAAMVYGGFDPVLAGAGGVAAGLSAFPGLSARSTWGGWSGLIALVLALGAAAQAAAPATAFLFLWPGLLAAAAAGLAAALDPGLTRWPSLASAALPAVVAIGWLISLGHPVFLGVGMDLPGALALLALLAAMLLRPMEPGVGLRRPLLVAVAGLLVLGAAASLTARFVEPMNTPAAQEA